MTTNKFINCIDFINIDKCLFCDLKTILLDVILLITWLQTSKTVLTYWYWQVFILWLKIILLDTVLLITYKQVNTLNCIDFTDIDIYWFELKNYFIRLNISFLEEQSIIQPCYRQR